MPNNEQKFMPNDRSVIFFKKNFTINANALNYLESEHRINMYFFKFISEMQAYLYCLFCIPTTILKILQY